MRILGLDVGDRRIGVALSDPGGILATPLTIIERPDDKQAIDAIVSIINQHQVNKVIVGLPYSMDGSLGLQADKVTIFVQHLGTHTNVPIEYRDERLTTVTAKQLMQEANPRKTKRRERDDAVAAAIILQGYLDEIRQR
ncbi:MAG: Holliday junction resolvase RuvX [Chloroflexi bacterium]|nr:Holliday junction resolvase RuvX [Chloroflexota bacterium]